VVCPLYQAYRTEAMSPRGMLALIDALDERMVLPTSNEVRRVLENCLFCQRCRKGCPVRIKPMERIMDGIARYGGKRRLHRFISRRISPLQKKGTLIFPGCVIERSETLFKAGLEAVKSLVNDFGVIRNTCCGAPFLEEGNLALAAFALERISHIARNAKRLVTLCPSCAVTLKESAGRFGIKIPRVLFIGELLKPNYKKEKAKVFHFGGCVSEAMGWAEKIRTYLRDSGVDVVSSEKALCCGKGTRRKTKRTNKRLSDALLENLFSEFKKSGCEILLTDCPQCLVEIRRLKTNASLLFDFLSAKSTSE